MSMKFKPGLEALGDRVVPAAVSFRLPNGTVGSGLFTTPSEYNPDAASQTLAITDWVMTSAGGEGYTVQLDPGPEAVYEDGDLVGVRVTATAEGLPTVSLEYDELSGAATATVAGYTVPLALDGAETEVTFTFSDGIAGAISYTFPWDAVNPEADVQYVGLPDFNLNIAGENFAYEGATARFEYGVLTGLDFDMDTSALADFPYTRLWMEGGLNVNAQEPAGGLPQAPPPRVAPAAPRALLYLDFSAAPGRETERYRVDLVVKSSTGETLATGSYVIGAGATAEDHRDVFADFLSTTGLKIVKVDGTAKVRLLTNGDTRLGAVTYDAFLLPGGGRVVGPLVLSEGGTASFQDGAIQ